MRATGLAMIVFGAMWALQGLGVLTWPADSFMLAQREWAMYGGITAGLGLFMLWGSRRLDS
ncbi:MAG: hypothetical protein AAGK02_04190 [Pseudomonadota bacterium]